MAAVLLAGALGATDFVDGYIARHFHQVSDLGKVLDPTADRLLFIVGVGGIMIDGAAPLIFSLLVLVRELAVGGAMVMLTALGMKRVDVSWWGKAGTLALMVSFPMFLLSEAGISTEGLFARIGWGFGIPGLRAQLLRGLHVHPRDAPEPGARSGRASGVGGIGVGGGGDPVVKAVIMAGVRAPGCGRSRRTRPSRS